MKNPELTLESRTVTPCGEKIPPRLLPIRRNGVTVRVPANRSALLMTNPVDPLGVQGVIPVSNMLTPMYSALLSTPSDGKSANKPVVQTPRRIHPARIHRNVKLAVLVTVGALLTAIIIRFGPIGLGNI